MSQPYLKEVDDVLTELKTTTKAGLAEPEANSRLAKYGPNELVEKGKKSVLAILFDQIKELMVIILIIAAVISFFLHEYIDAAVILVIVILNTVIGFWQEFKAENAMAALKKMAVPKVRVRRNGSEQEISARELVPGDILLIESGNIIPADARLIEAANLKVQESALTGESEPVEKHISIPGGADIPLGDRKNMIYMGTVITYGRGQAVVTDTGMNTELGKIATMIQEVEDEKTPLQDRLAKLSTKLAGLAVLLIIVVAAISLVRGIPVKETFMTAISMAVAAIPEGLPAVVTIALALGAQRMLKKKSLIRHLPAVETLGSVTVICSDKTGTLTQNKMTVTDIVLPKMSLKMNELSEKDSGDNSLEMLLLAGMFCNDAVLEKHAKNVNLTAIGDPTEGALVIAAAKLGISQNDILPEMPRAAELPFDSDRKRMTTVHSLENVSNERLKALFSNFGELKNSKYIAFTKGSLDGLLEVCTQIYSDGEVKTLSPAQKEAILTENTKMAENGIRVLGMAFKPLPEGDMHNSQAFENNLIYIGMSGMIDPVREEAVDAVAMCQKAGIRVVMITGDHPLTAQAIAKELGITNDGNYLTGSQLSQMSVDEIKAQVDKVSIYARVSPEHKMILIDALQEKNQIVSMTGDGVNDAPALKSADIGVSMGITGTDVARESSDMVLLDDNFATIVAAVKEGRTIFDNIRKFVNYILTGNTGEIIVMLVGPFLGMPIPLLPIQILWINLVTDGIPAIALGYEASEPEVMNRPPFNPKEGIFSRGIGQKILLMGLLIGAVSLIVGFFNWRIEPELRSWQTMIFTTLTFSQMAYAMAVKRIKQSLFSISTFRNKILLFGVGITFFLQLMLIYVPFLNQIFRTAPLNMNQLGLCFSGIVIIILITEIRKFFYRRKTV